MTKTDIKKRIQKAISTLNAMDNKVIFSMEEDEYAANIICESRTQKGTRFGSYCYIAIFDEYVDHTNAYANCMKFVETIIAATKLNDKKSYHNIAF